MDIKKAIFVTSNSDYEKCPKPTLPEYALIGRSNVGKSSLLNMLTGNKYLAKTSAKPGKTQLINHFIINDSWYLVDLPGYGWASVGKEKRAEFGKMTKDYLFHRPNLLCLFILVDSRLEPQLIDIEFIRWAGINEIPFALVFTKADKQTNNHTNASVDRFKKELSKEWEELPPIFITSSETGMGKEDLLLYIDEINKGFKVNN